MHARHDFPRPIPPGVAYPDPSPSTQPTLYQAMPQTQDYHPPPPQQPNNNPQQQPPPPQQQQHVLNTVTHSKDGRTYKLSVEQQPVRARMCGFGDKDRRPITPPPCVRLIVLDSQTGKEIPYEEVDSTFFVLTVDLWSMDGQNEVNLVRASSGAPTVSISTSTLTSFPPTVDRPWQDPGPYAVNQMRGSYSAPVPHYGLPAGPPLAQVPGYYPHAPPGPVAQQGLQYQQYPQSIPSGYAMAPSPQSMTPGAQNMAVLPPALPAAPASATGMFTRNLIGSLSVNAFRLHDPHGRHGFWFVLQDLSVRTEGMFRLKMNFVDVGAGNGSNTLNTGKAMVLASCFSEPFQVYSAKKFPGVIESTQLSKCFATQGIKIPIRKDGPKHERSEGGDDAGDSQDEGAATRRAKKRASKNEDEDEDEKQRLDFDDSDRTSPHISEPST